MNELPPRWTWKKTKRISIYLQICMCIDLKRWQNILKKKIPLKKYIWKVFILNPTGPCSSFYHNEIPTFFRLYISENCIYFGYSLLFFSAVSKFVPSNHIANRSMFFIWIAKNGQNEFKLNLKKMIIRTIAHFHSQPNVT